MNKFFSAINDLCLISCQIIKAGCILAIGLVLSSVIIFNAPLSDIFTIEFKFASEFAQNISVTIFAECVIGALLLDYSLKKYKKI